MEIALGGLFALVMGVLYQLRQYRAAERRSRDAELLELARFQRQLIEIEDRSNALLNRPRNPRNPKEN
jgi:hypothetical protein